MQRLLRPALITLRTALTLIIGLTLGLGVAPAPPATARDGNIATPGNFTGYGFDQCLAPGQYEMDRWLTHSPFLAVGIYVSGDSRGCRSQPNLTPQWVATQLRQGWRLLPITLGPQASCSPHFPRYGSDETIDPSPGENGRYGQARRQAAAQAAESVADAAALGISPGSALWYDLEAFDSTKTNCRESALRFLSAWSHNVKELGYLAGVYSSAGSGIAVLDQARAAGRSFTYPDYIWMARWDGVANTRTSYVSDVGWNPHRRIKQYLGGHKETWGGVTINIDSNYLDLGTGSVPPADGEHCGGVRLAFWNYNVLATGVKRPLNVSALQCLLTEKGLYTGAINGRYRAATIAAANEWQAHVGTRISATWSEDDWATLLSAGRTPVLKTGSAAHAVRRLQRALNALGDTHVPMTGLFDPVTGSALRAWQKDIGLTATGVAAASSWAALQR